MPQQCLCHLAAVGVTRDVNALGVNGVIRLHPRQEAAEISQLVLAFYVHGFQSPMGHRKPGQTVVVGVGAGVGYEKAPFFRHPVPLACLFKILRIAGHSVNGQHRRVPLPVPRPVAGGHIDIVKPGQTIDLQLHPAHPHLGAAFFIPQMIVAGAAPKGPAQHKTYHSLVLRFPGTVFLSGSVPHLRKWLVIDEPGSYRRLLGIDLAEGVAVLRGAVPAHELLEIPLQGTSAARPVCHKGRHGDVRLLPGGDAVGGE